MNKIEQIKKELIKAGFDMKRASEIKEDPKVRTGLFALDYVLGGGIAQCEGGHRIEFWGGESTGKTTFALHIVKKYQELTKVCAFINAEKSYDKQWADIIGIDNKELLIGEVDTLEKAGDLLALMIPKVDLLIVDSIVSLIPIGELERLTEEQQVALQARINALITRKIYNAINKKMTTVIFINQLREKVGTRFGSPDITGGGRAIKHMYNTRILFKTGKPIKEKDEKIGIEMYLYCNKNKKGIPYRRTSVDFYLNGYLDNKKSLFFAGKKYSVIERHGNTYQFGDVKVVGEEKFIEILKDKDWKKIEEEIWKRIK